MQQVRAFTEVFVLRLLTLLAYCTFMAGCHTQAIGAPGQMNTFRLEKSPLLKGFVVSQSSKVAPIFKRAPHAIDVFNATYFYGGSELTYSVLLFPDQTALQSWDKLISPSSPGWFSPLRSPQDRQGVRQSLLGGKIRTGEPRQTAIVVNRVLIAMYSHQHGATVALPDKKFVQLFAKVKAELIARAKRLPSNQG